MDKKHGCSELFTKYVGCLKDKGYEFKKCYNQRALFEACASEKIVIFNELNSREFNLEIQLIQTSINKTF